MKILRTRRPVRRGYTDINGMRTDDAPKNWPFGRVQVRPSKAVPKNRKHDDLGDALL